MRKVKECINGGARYEEWSKLHLFSRYCFNTDKVVPDPDFQTDFVYKTAMDMIEEGCRIILQKTAG